MAAGVQAERTGETMTEQTTGTCRLIAVDSRELYWLRKLAADLRDYVGGETLECMDETCARLEGGLAELEPWEDGPILEEWR